MKKFFYTLLVTLLSSTAVAADSLSLRKLFVEMPDSIIPYLSHNNRLDLLDFMDSNMKAEVTNEFSGKSVMTSLSEDSISIQLNESSRVEIFLLEVEPVNNDSHVIALVRSLFIEGEQMETDVEYYSVEWKRVVTEPKLSPSRKERMKKYANQSNIINFIKRKVNKD